MKHWWWKILATLLLLYVVVIGLRTPLAPALIACTPDRIAPGDVLVNVWGYNTRFQEGIDGSWVSNDGQWGVSMPLRSLVVTTLSSDSTFRIVCGLK
ncbi:MAG: hypothetical protein IPP33_11820 [Flavobacteriales bacterium]|nr:hypothetical protein [Flavobacteriales bacterium]